MKLNSDQNYIILYFIFLIIIIFNNKFINNYFFFYFFFCLVVFNQKNNIFDASIINYNINKNLLNGLLIIHPVILYTSYSMLFYIIYLKSNSKFRFLFFYKNIFNKKSVYLNTLIILLFSIFLGS